MKSLLNFFICLSVFPYDPQGDSDDKMRFDFRKVATDILENYWSVDWMNFNDFSDEKHGLKTWESLFSFKFQKIGQ